MARLRIKCPDPFQVFVYATAYMKAAATVGRATKANYPYDLPMAVLQVFSMELHLKCLVRMRGKRLKKREHDLDKIFAWVSNRDRRHIAKLMGGTDATIVSIEKRSKGVFPNLRYAYEGHRWPIYETIPAATYNEGFNEFIQAVRKLILKRRPAWDDECKSLLGLYRDEILQALQPHP